jgi:TPR repeat protein
MPRSLSVLVLLGLFTIGCPAAESNYNLGVEAWRAKQFAIARAHWEATLSEGGSDEAFNNLGYLLYHGEGGNSDKSRAIALWRKGAALGVSEAQLHLANAYQEGGGVPKNLTRAYAWYLCSIQTATKHSKHEPVELKILGRAERDLSKLLPRLSAFERSSGKRQAEELIGKYSTRLSTNEP